MTATHPVADPEQEIRAEFAKLRELETRLETVRGLTAQLAPVRVSEAAWASCSVRDCGQEWLGGSEVAGKAADHHNRTGHRVVVVTTVTEAYEAGDMR